MRLVSLGGRLLAKNKNSTWNMARIAPVSPVSDSAAPPPRNPSPTAERQPECNFHRLLANSPAALKAYLAMRDSLSQGELSSRQREELALAIAEMNGATYCLAAHTAVARKLGLKEDEIRLSRRATSTDPLSSSLLRFAQAVVLQRGEISDADFQALRRAGVSDAMIAEVLALIALNIFTNYFNSVTRTETDCPPPKNT